MATKILIIDDDDAIVESLQYLLEDAGYEVSTSQDGMIIYKNFYKMIPDVILLDYWLPRENGGEITKKLKSRAETKDIPIIIISASYNIKELVLDAGADDFLEKPYDIQDVLTIVDKHVRKEYNPL